MCISDPKTFRDEGTTKTIYLTSFKFTTTAS